MKVLARVLTGTALAAGLFSPVLPATSAFAGDDNKVQYVLLVSIDGFHAVDLAICVAKGTCPNLEKLTDHGFTYTNASTTKPSDSFPGLLAQITGGTSKSTGVFYDDSYDRALFAPLCTSGPGAEVNLAENTDKNLHSIDGGVPASLTGLNSAVAIDPNNLPGQKVNGPCTPLWPHNFIRTNTLFEEVDVNLSVKGRVMEVLSEHLCEGWLEGYLLTGRHGLFSCYEAFIHIIDSMLNQHAKWLKVSRSVPWRKPIASLNYLLTSHVWQQDHNGFSHQDPGFIDHVANKKSDIVRIYLPPDANCLLSVADHCLRSRNYINVIIAGKQPEWQWLDIDSAVHHCTVGAGIWRWASNDAGDPDVVMACAGDVPTLETLASVTLLRAYVPDIRIRVVNVVDLMVLQPQSEHPHGLEDQDFDELFTTDKPVIFAFHGYPAIIHKLTYRRHNHDNIHVRGYKEEGTTTTPFDMVVLNNLDRYQLALDAIQRIPRFRDQVETATARYWTTMERHKLYISEHGDDMPEVRNWRWNL